MDATPNALGWVRCPGCVKLFKLSDRLRWTGYRHRSCGQRIQLPESEDLVERVWCLVANIIAERPYGPGGQETRRGSKHFRPGAKVYCFPPLWGDGYEIVQVIGHHRGSHRLVTMVIRSQWLTNARAELVYSPSLLNQLYEHWDGSAESRQLAETLAQLVNSRHEP